MKTIPIPVEDYLRNEMSKEINLMNDKFNEFLDYFAQVHKNKYSNELKTERRDIMANTCTIQTPTNMNVEHNEKIRQKGNRIKDMQ